MRGSWTGLEVCCHIFQSIVFENVSHRNTDLYKTVLKHVDTSVCAQHNSRPKYVIYCNISIKRISSLKVGKMALSLSLSLWYIPALLEFKIQEKICFTKSKSHIKLEGCTR